MYDRTYDGIMADMMKDFGAGVRTDEGSLAFNACAKIASKLEDAYGGIEDIEKNLTPDTMDIKHLIQFAKERGVSYGFAKPVSVKAVFSQDIPLGSRLVCGDYTYRTENKLDGEHAYRLICEEDGTEANANLGTLTPMTYIDDYKGGKITEILIPGIDDEAVEDFRGRVIKSFESTAFGGNKADYRRFVNGIEGVGGCKPKRRDEASPWVNVTIINNDFGVPPEELVKKVQTVVDPEQSHGEGDGMAPCCHHVLIKPVEGVKMNLSATITFAGGYSASTSKSQIEAAVNKYLLELRKGWESNEFRDTVVRISQIEARILAVDGVLDITNTRLLGVEGNKTLPYSQIPLPGEVTINV